MLFQLLAEQQLMLAYALFVSLILGNLSIYLLRVYRSGCHSCSPLIFHKIVMENIEVKGD